MIDQHVKQAKVARLLMQHRTSLYGYILACVRSHVDAEDVLQDVSVAVTESIASLQNEEEFLVWAREIARRRVLAYCRQRGRARPIDPQMLKSLVEAADRVERTQPTSVRQAALMGCLETLPEHSRKLIELRYSGLAIEDVARQFGRTTQAVYAMIKRIKSILRDCVSLRLAQEWEA